jgi:hypothetical protein
VAWGALMIDALRYLGAVALIALVLALLLAL